MFDHSDSIRDILQNAKDELKNNPELKKEQEEYQRTVQSTNGDQKLLLDNPKQNFDEPLVLSNLNEIKDNILTLNNEVIQNQDVLVLKNEIEVVDENILYLDKEYKPNFDTILELSHEINLNEPLLLDKEFETSISDLETELSNLSKDIVGDDPIYDKVETIDRQQSDIQAKLENIYEKIEDSDKETEIKLDLLSNKIENDVNEKVHNIDESLEAIKNSTKIDELRSSFIEYNEELRSSLELSVSTHIGNVQVTVDNLLENNEQFKHEVKEHSEIFKQQVTDQSEAFRNEMLNSHENLRVEFLDNLRVLEEERRRIEDERIERENSPQRKLEKRFDEISSVLESHNLKMQAMYNSMEMQHNQTMVQTAMNNFMNNISNYEKKLDEKINEAERKQNQDIIINNPIIDLEKKIEERLKSFEKNINDYKVAQNDTRLENIEKRIEERFRDFERSLDKSNQAPLGKKPSLIPTSGDTSQYVNNVNNNIELFKKFIDNKFLAFDDLVQNFAILSRSLKDQLSHIDGMTPDVVSELKKSISESIQSELNVINNKLIKFDDWMSAIQTNSQIKIEDYSEIKKFNDIEEARQFISEEIILSTKNWIKDNKNKIDELAKILLF